MAKGRKKSRGKNAERGQNSSAPSGLVAPRAMVLAPWKASPVLNRTFRFRCASSTTDESITSQMLVRLMVMCTSTTTYYSLIRYVRVRRVTMFDSSGGFIELSWVGPLYPGNAVVNAQGTSAFPSYLTSTPPSGGDAGNWISNATASSTAVFELTGTANTTVVDVNVDYLTTDDVGSPAALTLTTSGTTGQIYFNALDGTANKWTSAGDPQTH